MRLTCLSCFFCLTLAAGSAGGAVADHVFWVDVEYCWNFNDPTDPGDTEYEFALALLTDATVKRVEVLTPGGRSFQIVDLPDQYDPDTGIRTDYGHQDDEDAWEWEYEHALSTPDELSQYGDGWYRVTVVYRAGGWDQTMIWFGVPGTTEPLAQPVQEPVPVAPPQRQSVGSPVTFKWQPCTDANVRCLWVWAEMEAGDVEVDCGTPLDKGATTWGPVHLEQGFWEAGIVFINGYHPLAGDNLINADGIPYAVVKIAEIEFGFAVERPWMTYQVWGGQSEPGPEDEQWRYYLDPGAHGYTLLGESDGETKTFEGKYTYYIILTREALNVDAVRGSDRTYYQSWYLVSHNAEPWGNYLGPPDSQYTTIGMWWDNRGWVRIANPGAWTAITVMTDRWECPLADLTGDCVVDFADLAIVAAQWMTGR